METKIIHITKENIEATAKEAADVWAQGGLVAFPTETVYGLGGNGLNKEASKKIYAAKGRPSDNPLILHIADMEQFYPLIKTDNAKIIARAEALAVYFGQDHDPDFAKGDNIPYETTGGLDTVAILYAVPLGWLGHYCRNVRCQLQRLVQIFQDVQVRQAQAM